MYKTIIFDIDGTLINTEEAVLGSLQNLLKKHYNKEMSPEELSFVLGIPGAISLKQLGIDNVDWANDYWNKYMRDFQHTISIFDGIKQLLEKLNEKSIPMGVVTSKTKQEFNDDFVPFGLANLLPIVVCADDTNQHKPHPEPLLKFLDISDTDNKQSIYIGDTIYDYECARDAGIDFGLALWGCKNPDSIPAKYKFNHPSEIVKLLLIND